MPLKKEKVQVKKEEVQVQKEEVQRKKEEAAESSENQAGEVAKSSGSQAEKGAESSGSQTGVKQEHSEAEEKMAELMQKLSRVLEIVASYEDLAQMMGACEWLRQFESDELKCVLKDCRFLSVYLFCVALWLPLTRTPT